MSSGATKNLSSTLHHNCAWKGFSYLQFEGSLSSFHAADLIQSQFLIQTFSLEIKFLTFPPELQPRKHNWISYNKTVLGYMLYLYRSLTRILGNVVQPMKFIVAWSCDCDSGRRVRNLIPVKVSENNCMWIFLFPLLHHIGQWNFCFLI